MPSNYLDNATMNGSSMSNEDKEDTRTYKVVVNHEEQYSILFIDQDNPIGWRDAGKSGTKAECLAYIGQVWTDMRPLSLRRASLDT
jgi:MbtH protein